ncbi:Arylsulfatase [Planctomycetes bacterium Poly30]|uniref:Arylsulfatase n=1 Tax=Saltatorellus ferox TaxID=2528018 RepID=A0A518EYK6_9BACT|nr:Arylsulfatase [Planctomycetes bacterium Poly30]
MLLSLLLWSTGLAAAPQEVSDTSTMQAAEARPNVLFILADDYGWMDAGFQNAATFYDTPNLDRLRAGGVQLTAAYAACPVCSPTRASILTGRHPARIDTTDWFGAPQPDAIVKAGREGAKRMERFQKLALLPAPYVEHLPQEEITLPEVLKGAGYATFFAGKWHLGGDGFEPETQGFDINVAGHVRGGPYGPGRYFHPFGMPNLESKEGDHLPARLAEEAASFIETERDEPWLCYLSFYSVHTPLMGRADLVEKYKKKRDDLGLEPSFGQEGERKVRQNQEHAVYAAMVAAMDEAVGHVLDALDRSGQADRTLVVFFSDNGGLSTSEGSPTSNLPLRGGKGWLYEGGIREPCVVRWPGRIPAGATLDLPIQSVDFLPTILAAAGVAAPTGVELDGVSLMPALTSPASAPGPEASGRSLYWHYPHHGNQGGFPGGAVRQGRWKWIERFGEGGELYDLLADVGEARECSAEHPEISERLASDLAAWRNRVNAKMPAPNPLLADESDD